MTGKSRARLCVATIALALAGCKGHPPASAAEAADSTPQLTPAQQARLHTVTLAAVPFKPTVDITGTVAFNGERSTQVLAPISGTVLRIVADVGTHVHAGDPLALVSSPDFAANLSALRRAQTSWVNAQRIATRDSALFANDALARQELEQAQTDAASAAADRDAALEALRAIGTDSSALKAIEQGRPVPPQQGVIRAPLSGTVVERLLNPGQLIQAGGTPAFTIADMSTVWVIGNVFESELGDVAIGDAAQIRLTSGDRVFNGNVTYVGALVDPDTRATAVRIVTPNPGEFLKKDMFVRVTVVSHRARSGLLVPAPAVMRDQNNLPFVFLQAGAGSYTRKLVTLGSHVGDQYEITSGLKAGDRVIAEGALFLQFQESQ
ncbi:MAG TPA: efflux RND transporter periplasmic adaptor subunit [Gemmatimonadales bacterium]|jgi:cobalt-zinc-cadmium efflux system membrane fusion protein